MKNHYREEPIKNINELQAIVDKARAIALALGQPDDEDPDTFHYEEAHFRYTGHLTNPTTWAESRKTNGNWIPQLWMAQDGSIRTLLIDLDTKHEYQWFSRLETLYESIPEAVV